MKLRLGDQSASDLLNTNKQEAWGEASRQRWLRELENARVKLLEGTRAVKAPDGGSSTLPLPHQIHSFSRVTGTDQPWPACITRKHTDATQEAIVPLGGSELKGSTSVAAVNNCAIGVAEEGLILEKITALMGEDSSASSGKTEHTDKAVSPRAGAGERWSAEHLHLTTDENGVVVWLRDASIGNETQTRVAESLRKGFAELGVHLSRIYLNGHPVVFSLACTK